MPESISGVSGVGSRLQRGRFWPIGLLPFRVFPFLAGEWNRRFSGYFLLDKCCARIKIGADIGKGLGTCFALSARRYRRFRRCY